MLKPILRTDMSNANTRISSLAVSRVNKLCHR